jgi:starch phosphorylase
MPHFNSTRMLDEYVARFYAPAAQHYRRFREGEYALARALAAWKARVRAAWDGVVLRRLDAPPVRAAYGRCVQVEVAAALNGLDPGEVALELAMMEPDRPPRDEAVYRIPYAGEHGGELPHRYRLELAPHLCGKLDYRIRAYPCHELLTHRFEMGLLRWL